MKNINKNLKKFLPAFRQIALSGKYYPTHRVGSGSWTSNYTSAVGFEDLGLVRGKHFVCGNDAPRGGACGDYQRLTSAGRRLVIVKKLLKMVADEIAAARDGKLK